MREGERAQHSTAHGVPRISCPAQSWDNTQDSRALHTRINYFLAQTFTIHLAMLGPIILDRSEDKCSPPSLYYLVLYVGNIWCWWCRYWYKYSYLYWLQIELSFFIFYLRKCLHLYIIIYYNSFRDITLYLAICSRLVSRAIGSVFLFLTTLHLYYWISSKLNALVQWGWPPLGGCHVLLQYLSHLSSPCCCFSQMFRNFGRIILTMKI